ncbi:GFA family protein [Shimia sp.]|uniref:GFA family protein n=1 Tax=Shimia sp. TaxID=1954381 RepID=UPI0032988058
MSGPKTGQCMCGAVTFAVKDTPAKFNSCYCDMCRRWTGSRFLGVPLKQADLSVADMSAVSTIQSSDWAERGFCNRCGTALWYKALGTDRINLSAGLFDDTDDLTLEREFFVDQKTCVHAFPETRIQLTRAETIA